ncbi:MAG: preprotein translocase subunit SecG [Myxococcales bacterium]|nr:preprotein translocase subunit SecG [Myxococcales bacterium]
MTCLLLTVVVLLQAGRGGMGSAFGGGGGSSVFGGSGAAPFLTRFTGVLAGIFREAGVGGGSIEVSEVRVRTASAATSASSLPSIPASSSRASVEVLVPSSPHARARRRARDHPGKRAGPWAIAAGKSPKAGVCHLTTPGDP